MARWHMKLRSVAPCQCSWAAMAVVRAGFSGHVVGVPLSAWVVVPVQGWRAGSVLRPGRRGAPTISPHGASRYVGQSSDWPPTLKVSPVLLPVALSQMSSRPQPWQEYSTLCSRNNLAARGTLITVARSGSRAVHGGPSRPTPIRTVQAGDVPSHRSSSSGAQAVNPVTADVPSRSLWQSERHSGDSRHGGSGEHRRRHGVASPVGRVTVEWWRDDSIAIGAFMRRN